MPKDVKVPKFVGNFIVSHNKPNNHVVTGYHRLNFLLMFINLLSSTKKKGDNYFGPYPVVKQTLLSPTDERLEKVLQRT